MVTVRRQTSGVAEGLRIIGLDIKVRPPVTLFRHGIFFPLFDRAHRALRTYSVTTYTEHTQHTQIEGPKDVKDSGELKVQPN